MAVGAGVAVDGRAHRTGNAGQRFQALQSAVDSEIHQSLKLRARFGAHYASHVGYAARREPQHDSRKSRVGDDQISSIADHRKLRVARANSCQSLYEAWLRCSLNIQLRRAADPESCVTAQQSVLGNR